MSLTRNEINRKISEARSGDVCYHDYYMHPDGDMVCWKCTQVEMRENWHADANWPTLLRELPRGSILVLAEDNLYSIEVWDASLEESKTVERIRDLGEAVCLAWLKWKGVDLES